MRPVLFQLGDLNIYSYGFFVALGIIAATLYLMSRVKREGGSPETVIDLILITVISGLIGARLAYILLYDPRYYLEHPWRIFMLQEGGLAFYGAFILGLLAAVIFLRKARIPVLGFLDLVAPAVALGYAVARIGCFFNGCCYGRPTDLPWGVVFPVIDGLRRHPTQIYSVLAGLLIFAFLEWKTRRGIRFPGQIFSLFLIPYGLLRAGIELLRENTQITGGPATASLAALALAAAGGAFYFLLQRLARSEKAVPPDGAGS